MKYHFKKINKIIPRISALLLSFIIAFAASACASSSDNDVVSDDDENKSVSSADLSQPSTEKEEVIYANLSPSGAVEEVYVVNIFGAGNVTDYGLYSEVEMLNTSDVISQDGDEITFTASDERTYYKGILENAELPWDISVRYFIDGKEYTSKQVAGMSGCLELHFSVSQNPKCSTDFYESYAVQASLTFDTLKFFDITAEGATIANVGGDKQITYTILPGEGLEAVITADVTDFEMGSIAVNGVPLAMEIDVDYSELTDLVYKLSEAIDAIDSGAGELADGTGSLYGGISTVQSALSQVSGNSYSLTSGSAEVLSALEQIQSALSKVSDNTDKINQLVEGSAQIAEALSSITEGAASLSSALSGYKDILLENGLPLDELQSANEYAVEKLSNANQKIAYYKMRLSELKIKIMDTLREALPDDFPELDIHQYTQQIDNTINTLTEAMENLEELVKDDYLAINGIEEYIERVTEGALQLAEGSAILNESYTALDEGINTLSDQINSLLENLSTLKDAINTLVKEYSNLDSGIGQYTDAVAQILTGYGEVVNGAKALEDGANTLSEGTAELREETDGMDTKVSDRIDEMISDITGGDFDLVSFVSEKNKNVKMVQFVIKTDAVTIPDVEVEIKEADDNRTLWQRITDLFK